MSAKSHQRSWWILHTQAHNLRESSQRAGYQRSTNCVGGIRKRLPQPPLCRPGINDPPTALVGFEVSLSIAPGRRMTIKRLDRDSHN